MRVLALCGICAVMRLAGMWPPEAGSPLSPLLLPALPGRGAPAAYWRCPLSGGIAEATPKPPELFFWAANVRERPAGADGRTDRPTGTRVKHTHFQRLVGGRRRRGAAGAQPERSCWLTLRPLATSCHLCAPQLLKCERDPFRNGAPERYRMVAKLDELRAPPAIVTSRHRPGAPSPLTSVSRQPAATSGLALRPSRPVPWRAAEPQRPFLRRRAGWPCPPLGPYTCPCDSCLLSAARCARHPGGWCIATAKLAGGGGREDYSSRRAPLRAAGAIGQSERCLGVIDVQRGAILFAGESKHVRPPGWVLIGRSASQ